MTWPLTEIVVNVMTSNFLKNTLLEVIMSDFLHLQQGQIVSEVRQVPY